MKNISTLVKELRERLAEIEAEREHVATLLAYYTQDSTEGLNRPASSTENDEVPSIRAALLRYLEDRVGQEVPLSDLCNEVERVGLSHQSKNVRNLVSSYIADFAKAGWCEHGKSMGYWRWLGRNKSEDQAEKPDLLSTMTSFGNE